MIMGMECDRTDWYGVRQRLQQRKECLIACILDHPALVRHGLWDHLRRMGIECSFIPSVVYQDRLTYRQGGLGRQWVTVCTEVRYVVAAGRDRRKVRLLWLVAREYVPCHGWGRGRYGYLWWVEAAYHSTLLSDKIITDPADLDEAEARMPEWTPEALEVAMGFTAAEHFYSVYSI